MKLFSSLIAAAVVVVAIVLATRPQPSATPSGPEVPVEVAAGEARGSDPRAAATPPATSVQERREEVRPATKPIAAPIAPAARGRVLVVDESGAPIAGAEVALEDTGLAGRTDAAGLARLALESLPAATAPQRAVLRLGHDDYLPLRAEVELGAQTDDLGRFTLVRGGSLTGRVLDETGAGVAGASVVLADPGQHLWESVVVAAASGWSGRTTLADERGRFSFRGLPSGPARVWAGADGHVDGMSELLSVRAGEAQRELTVTLGPAPAELEIAGRVVLPEGRVHEELTGLSVWSTYESPEGGRSRRSPVAADGRFRIRVEADEPHDLWAQQDPGAWDERLHVFTGERALPGLRGVVAREVQPGTANLVLGFEPAPKVDVRVLDEDGRELERFVLGVIEFSGNDLRQELPWFRELSAPVSLSVPARGFWLSIEAEGHSRVDLGPYDPVAVPDPIVARLERVPPLAGIVRAAGRPLEGARIELLRAGDDRHVIQQGGFKLRMHGVPRDEALSDANGEFGLTVRRRDRYFVIARAPGLALAEFGPLELGPDLGHEGLVLELTEGGAVEGRLRLPPGESPAGWIVGASRGDPYPLSTALREDGQFRFEGLTPGEWSIERMARLDRTSSTSSSRSPVVWKGNCTVEAGRTTHFDLDFRDARVVVVKGRLALKGRELEGSQVRLLRASDAPFGGERVDGTVLDADGEFQLTAPEPGSYQMVIEVGQLAEGGILISRELELAGPAFEWSEEVRLGTLEGLLEGDGVSALTRVVWIVEQGTSITATPLRPLEGGRLSSEVPAGSGRVRGATQETEEDLPLTWPELGRAEVPPGEVGRFEPVD